MKLIIQIPCYNEAATLPVTLKALPRKVKGFKKVEWLIINDGSSDDTAAVAKQYKVDHIVSFNKNKGLAEVFRTGLAESLKRGADVIVNTDADNQYCADDIHLLTTPILEGRADIVIGARPITTISHFSPLKKLLQKAGSWAVRKVSNTSVDDAPSGFRAFSREAALKLNVFGTYTYTLETIIQSGWKNINVLSVPIRVNGFLRPSRLMKSMFSYIKKSLLTIVRIYAVYKPFKFFAMIGVLVFTGGVALGVRFLVYYFFIDGGKGHVQSLILAAILLLIGFQTVTVGFLADIVSVNRLLLEDVQYRLRKMENERIRR